MKKIFKITTLAAMLLFSSNIVSYAQEQKQNEATLELTLNKALEIALDKNLTLKIAELNVERVDYSRKENWLALLPSLNGSFQYTNNIMKPVFFADFFPGGKMEVGSNNSFAGAGALQLPIFSLALYKNIQLSEIELKATLESARNSKLDLIMQVKNTFYGVIMLKESLKVLEQSYKNAQESASNIKMMFENGMASEYDMIRSDVAVRNITPSLTQSKNALEMTKMQLKILLSLEINTIIDVAGELGDYETEVSAFEEKVADLSANSDLITVEIQKSKLKKNIELINAQRLPTFTGVMNYSVQMQSNEFTISIPWSNSLSAGLAVQIPIFNKFSINLKEKQALIGLRQLEFQKQLLQDNLAVVAKNSMNEMQRAKIQLQSDKEAVKQAVKGYDISKVRYNTGAGTILELNDSEVALTRAKLTYNQTLYDYLKAKNSYEKVIGKEN